MRESLSKVVIFNSDLKNKKELAMQRPEIREMMDRDRKRQQIAGTVTRALWLESGEKKEKYLILFLLKL